MLKVYRKNIQICEYQYLEIPINMDCTKAVDSDFNGEHPIEKFNEAKAIVKGMDCFDEENIQKSNIKDLSKESQDRLLLRKSIVYHICSACNDQVSFKSLNEAGEEVDQQEKLKIADEMLDSNYGLFLAKFGNYLLKEHLCYFEDRNEEESLIVDLHLAQLNRAFEKRATVRKIIPSIVTKYEASPSEDMDIVLELSAAEKKRLDLRNKLLDHLSLSRDAHFKSQQVGEPDLNQGEKREIAEEFLDRSAGLFLARFGTHLLEEHLAYFDSGVSPEESYEVDYHLKHLRQTHCKSVSKVGIKNRRFEALKKMVGEGSYFCESEMRNRNPLLYEQLVGRFLTPDERKERIDNIDTTNITFVNLLLEQMDRENVKKLRKEQEDEEDNEMEDEEDFEDEMEAEEDSDSEEDNDLDKTLWGEEFTDGESYTSKPTAKKSVKKFKNKTNEEDIEEKSDAEKKLLLDEFRSSMFSSFLQGKDVHFDYSEVDYNSDYDDLEARGQDEEEKYFDEESPQDANSSKMSDDEDLLEQYMNNLEPEPTTQQLTDKMNALSHQETRDRN